MPNKMDGLVGKSRKSKAEREQVIGGNTSIAERIERAKTSHLLESGNDLDKVTKGNALSLDDCQCEDLEIEINQLCDNPKNPRIFYAQADIDALADSITKEGQLIPLIVTPSGSNDGKYIVVDGHYRLKAMRQARITVAKCEVRDITGKDLYLIGRTVNEQRSEQSVFDDALSFRTLLDDGTFQSQNELALAINKGRDYVSKAVQITEIPRDSIDLLFSKPTKVGLSSAYAVLQLYQRMGGSEGFYVALEQIVKEDWSRAKIEVFTKNIDKKKGGNRKTRKAVTSTTRFSSPSGERLGQITQTDEAITVKYKALNPTVATEIQNAITKIIAEYSK